MTHRLMQRIITIWTEIIRKFKASIVVLSWSASVWKWIYLFRLNRLFAFDRIVIDIYLGGSRCCWCMNDAALQIERRQRANKQTLRIKRRTMVSYQYASAVAVSAQRRVRVQQSAEKEVEEGQKYYLFLRFHGSELWYHIRTCPSISSGPAGKSE